jgi:hypothetical protein
VAPAIQTLQLSIEVPKALYFEGTRAELLFKKDVDSEAARRNSQSPQMDKGAPSLSYPDGASTARFLKDEGKCKPVLPQYNENVETTSSRKVSQVSMTVRLKRLQLQEELNTKSNLQQRTYEK